MIYHKQKNKSKLTYEKKRWKMKDKRDEKWRDDREILQSNAKVKYHDFVNVFFKGREHLGSM